MANEQHETILEKLPQRLHFLISPALKYGHLQFDEEIADFASRVSDADRLELKQVCDKMNSRDFHEEYDAFLDTYPISKYPDAAKLYFLFGVIDAVVGFPSPPELTWEENVDERLRELTKFGSRRLAAIRAHAARFFTIETNVSRRATPYLIRACSDEDDHVRVWAHCAFAMIDHAYEKHIAAIENIQLKFSSQKEDYDLLILEAVEAVSKIHAYQDRN